MKIKTFILYLICTLFYSCSSNEKEINKINIVNSFPVNYALTADSIIVREAMIAPMGVTITGDYLIVYNMGKKKLFDCFKLPECRYLYSAIEIGGGPQDFYNSIDLSAFNSTSTGFDIVELGIPTVKHIEVSDTAMSIKNSPFLEIAGIVRYLSALSNNLYLASNENLSEEYELQLYDAETKERIEFSNYPKYDNVELDNTIKRKFVAMKSLAVHPDKEKFAFFYTWFKEFRIYNNSGTQLNRVQINIPPVITSYEHDVDRRIDAYGQSYATSNYIYVFSRSDLKNEETDKIEVWDWEGNPVSTLSFDLRLQCFAVDESDSKLYATSPWNSEDAIYTFDIPSFKK